MVTKWPLLQFTFCVGIMHILRATESGYTEMNKKNLFSLPLSITAFYDTKNFNKDGQQIETFPCNGFYFQDELVWN